MEQSILMGPDGMRNDPQKIQNYFEADWAGRIIPLFLRGLKSEMKINEKGPVGSIAFLTINRCELKNENGFNVR